MGGRALTIRTDQPAAELRRLARREKDRAAAARMQAIAGALEGLPRAESLYANKSLTAPGFGRRAVVRSLRSRCARRVSGAQDAGVRHRSDMVRLGRCAL